MQVIGRCSIDVDVVKTNMPHIIYTENTTKGERPIWKAIYPEYHAAVGDDSKFISAVYERTYPRPGFWDTYTEEKAVESFSRTFGEWLEEYEDNVLKCYGIIDQYAIVGYSHNYQICWMFPLEYVSIDEYKDYSMLTGSQRRQLISGESYPESSSLVSQDSLVSLQDVKEMQSDAKSRMKQLEQEIKDVKESKAEGLVELQAQIDAMMATLEEKKRGMMAELEQKKAEMELALEKMELEVFRLDSEIYAIRCYTGEVLELKKLISGKDAPDDTPLVFYQKLRYLDEELGRIASIYDADFGDAKHLEALLQHRQDVRDYFLPSDRCITLIRVSRSGVGFHHTDQQNILDWYEKYHGRKVAILMRNGSNIYIAWTDDDRINFSDDAFFKPGVHEMTDAEIAASQQGKYESDKDYAKRMKSEKMKNIREGLGRYFVFSLLQGMVDRHIIKFPEKINFMKSKYIIWSYADGWLTTNEYGEFTDMIDRCNESVKVGDIVLLTDSIRPERRTGWSGQWVDQSYHNDRGRGEKNRTHDVVASDNTKYKINLIEHSAKYTYETFYHEDPEKIDEHDHVWTDEELKEFKNRNWSAYPWAYRNLTKVDGSDEYAMFISLEKDENWETGKCARANFEIYKDEFINLTFMNSIWLQYVLTNQKTSRMRIHGQYVDFAYVIPYIKSVLQHCREREAKVAEWIDKINPELLKNEKWPVLLSEWMIKNDVHNFSEFRTKQFCRSLL